MASLECPPRHQGETSCSAERRAATSARVNEIRRLTSPSRTLRGDPAVELPEAYPYKSPSIGFVNRIFHPNVDEGCATRDRGRKSARRAPLNNSLCCDEAGHQGRRQTPPLSRPSSAIRAGSVCLDVINQTWSPMFGAPPLRALAHSPPNPLDVENVL